MSLIPSTDIYIQLDKQEAVYPMSGYPDQGMKAAYKVLLGNAGQGAARIRRMLVRFRDVEVDITSKKLVADAFIEYCNMLKLPKYVDGAAPCADEREDLCDGIRGNDSIYIIPPNSAHTTASAIELVALTSYTYLCTINMDSFDKFLNEAILHVEVSVNIGMDGVQDQVDVWDLPLNGNHPAPGRQWKRRMHVV